MWEAETLREIARHKAHSGQTACVATEFSYKVLLTGGLQFSHILGTVTCLYLSKDGSVLVSGSKDKCVGIWHTVTGQQSL